MQAINVKHAFVTLYWFFVKKCFCPRNAERHINGHINALNRKTEKLAEALEQQGAQLSSFLSLTDKRMKNLVH